MSTVTAAGSAASYAPWASTGVPDADAIDGPEDAAFAGDVEELDGVRKESLEADAAAAGDVYVPTTVVNVLATTLTVCTAGGTMPGTGPKDTLYEPGLMDCHMPQSFRAMRSTEIVAASAGSVRTRRKPWTSNTPVTSAAWPATTSMR